MAHRSSAAIASKLRNALPRRRIFGVAAAVILPVVLVAGAVAFADVPDSGVVHACFDKATGRVRIVDHTGCEPDERKITWSERGRDGQRGEAGPAGPKGEIGAPGARGPVGPAGALGPKGDAGPPGPQGLAGPIGPQGPAGPDGAPGPRGFVGPDGAVGPQGLPGPEGPAGPTGPAGAAGARGPSGPAGVAGAPGPQGPRGPAGISGFEMVTARMPPSGFSSESPKQAIARCPDGKRVIGTGADVEGDSGDLAGRVTLQSIMPVSRSEARGVAAEVAPGTNLKWAVVAIAFCATEP
jgi:hypothetical protein